MDLYAYVQALCGYVHRVRAVYTELVVITNIVR